MIGEDFLNAKALWQEADLTEMYKELFPSVARFVSKRGGSFEQAKDIFHDAVIIWYEKQESAQIQITLSDRAYIFGIVKNLWFNNFSKHISTLSLTDILPDEQDEIYEEASQNRLLNLLKSSGKRCLDLLTGFYYNKLSMKELAFGFGFKSEHSATVQKYKCLERVRETVKEKSLHYEDFLE